MLDVGSPRIITASSIHHPSSFITRLSSLIIIHHFPLPAAPPPPLRTISTTPPDSDLTERVHGIYREPWSVEIDKNGRYLAQCNAGVCPNDLLEKRIYPGGTCGEPPRGKTVALFRYNHSYTSADRRVSYYSEKYPWLRQAARFPQPANLHSDYDLLAVAINNTLPDDGGHFLIHWFADMNGASTFYNVSYFTLNGREKEQMWPLPPSLLLPPPLPPSLH